MSNAMLNREQFQELADEFAKRFKNLKAERVWDVRRTYIYHSFKSDRRFMLSQTPNGDIRLTWYSKQGDDAFHRRLGFVPKDFTITCKPTCDRLFAGVIKLKEPRDQQATKIKKVLDEIEAKKEEQEKRTKEVEKIFGAYGYFGSFHRENGSGKVEYVSDDATVTLKLTISVSRVEELIKLLGDVVPIDLSKLTEFQAELLNMHEEWQEAMKAIEEGQTA